MPKKKILLLVFLLSLLFLLLFYSHSEFAQNDYSNTASIFDNYQQFINKEITFEAKIYEIDPSNQTLLANIVEPPYLLVAIDTQKIEHQLQKDDFIFVIGVLTGENTISAEKIIVRPPEDDYAIFLISVPAIPFALYLFFRSWRFNWKTFSFERRYKHA